MFQSTKLLIIVAFFITIIKNICSVYNNLTYNGKVKSLVLIDDWHYLDTHSLFWEQLRAMNFELEFKMIDDTNIKLTYFGEYLYSSIIFLAPSYSEEFAKKGDIKIPNLIKFFDDGHDIIVFGNKEVGSFLRKFVTEFGVDFDDYDSQVKDSLYLHNSKENLNPDLIKMKNSEIIVTKNTINISAVTKHPKGFILYEGIGMEIDSNNQYIFPILRADENSYSINTKTGQYFGNGEKIKLVNGYQARNNRRVVISGSTSLCSDKFYFLSSFDGTNPLNSPNASFCQDILNWNFQKSGVLKYENIRHQRQSDGVSLSTYRVKENLEYMIDIYEFDAKTNTWKPYLTDDLQLEFVMMNPYYIQQMKMISPNKPTYYINFKAPDKFGVFKFIIDYKRLGYSYLEVSTKVPLRPFNHNEYPRFLPTAYPYYVSVFSILLVFVIFSLVFVFGKNKDD